MELHEYQVKSLLSRFGVLSPPHTLIEAGGNIEASLVHFGFEPILVKAQVHGTGRKDSGGEIAVNRPKELIEAVKAMLGKPIVTSESGPKGFLVSKVMVMSVPSYMTAFQLKIEVTSSGTVELSACQSGGKVFTEHLFEGRLHRFQLNRLASKIGIQGPLVDGFSKTLDGIVRTFLRFDAVLLEIDPLVLTEARIFQVLSCRMCVDEYAFFRQPELVYMADSAQVGPKVTTPPYVCLQMDGAIGCLSNGLSMALATGDLITRFRGYLGCLVTIGSDVQEEKLVLGLKMLRERKSRVIFLNIFTGLVDGEKIAKVIEKEIDAIPIVVRLEGTNSAGGQRLLKALAPRCTPFSSLQEAAKLVVDLSLKAN